MAEIKPVVDDQFWFDRSGEMVKGAIERLDLWAEKIKNLFIWALPIYTGNSIFTVEYKKISEWKILIVLAAPYFLIILTYWLTQNVQKPMEMEFDVRSPDSIRDSYKKAYKGKSTKILALSVLSFISVCILSAALILAYFLKNQQKEAFKEPIYLTGEIDRSVKERPQLFITGRFPADSLIEIKVTRMYFDTISESPVFFDSSYKKLNSKEGVLQEAIIADTNIHRISYLTAWNESGYKKGLQKEFIFKPLPKRK